MNNIRPELLPLLDFIYKFEKNFGRLHYTEGDV